MVMEPHFFLILELLPMTRLIGCGIFAVCLLVTNSVNALPPFPGLLTTALKDDADSKKFLDAVGMLKMKCDVCHKPGVDKAKDKNHGLNDFGEAMHESVDFKALKPAIKDKDTVKMLELFKAGYAKAIAEKNADGKTYGELINAGSLPGKNG
jgi:hypothetical protein